MTALAHPAPSRRGSAVAATGLALLCLAAVGCDVNRGRPLGLDEKFDDGEFDWESLENAEPMPHDLPTPPEMPNTPLSGDGVQFPPGLSTEDLARGRVALFDGATLFGWSVDGGEASVDPPNLALHDKDASGCAAGAEFRMPLPAGAVHLEAFRPADGEVWMSFDDGYGRGGRDYPYVSGTPAEGADEWIPATLSLAPPVAPEDRAWEADSPYHAPAILGVRGNDDTAVRFIEFLPETEPLSLESFTPVAGNQATVTRDGELRLVGGPGFLVSEQQYGDFVLQCEVNLNAPDSNSGLFFRTMEPTADAPSNGYEVQLQNTLGPGGRTDPDDYGEGFGTGGIFRRQAARYVNANDGEWFHLTLVVVGNRMATWVNGLQVTDFTDERDSDPNPRKGRRDEAGHLVLQGHDPTTDVSFRNVRIQELSTPADDSTESD